MRKLLSFLVVALLAFSAAPFVLATSVGGGIGIDITPDEFAPLIWHCGNRIVVDDCLQAGRVSDCSQFLAERFNNYAFEGEQIGWRVLVMDKNKIEEVSDVVATIGSSQGVGNDIQVECSRAVGGPVQIPAECNARIGQQLLTTFNPDTMAYYDCIFTVESPDTGMQGEYFLTAEVISEDGEATMDEDEFWFFNPIIALTIDGDLEFSEVTPGSVSYSDTILVGNDAEAGSGVMLDMFISGTNFYDSDDSGAKCPTTNHLKLSRDLRSQANLGAGLLPGPTMANPCDIDAWVNDAAMVEQGVDNHDHLCYKATNGAYGTHFDARRDAEGYVPIVYSDIFTRDFYNDAEIINTAGAFYSPGNVLSPGAEIALSFKLGLPEPCVGNFDTGDIYFWGEAV